MNSHRTRLRNRSAILADIQAIPFVMEGTLTEYRQKNKKGAPATRHHLQKWAQGRNQTQYVKQHELEHTKKGIENKKRLDALVAELAATDEAAFFAGGTLLPAPAEDPAKKKRMKSSPPSPGRSAKPPATPSCT